MIRSANAMLAEKNVWAQQVPLDFELTMLSRRCE